MRADFITGLKVCSICKKVQPISNFYKNAGVKSDGLGVECIVCWKTRYKLAHPGKPIAREGFKFCSGGNLELVLAEFDKNKQQKSGLSPQCKGCASLYYQENKDAIQQRNRQWYVDHRKEANSYARERRKSDPLFKLSHNLRVRTYDALKGKSFKKSSKLSQYLGCTVEELKVHLEKQFALGMTWDNWSSGSDKWNIDHIIPLSSAKTVEELYELCHYTNLQPLWQIDNFKKHDKILGE